MPFAKRIGFSFIFLQNDKLNVSQITDGKKTLTLIGLKVSAAKHSTITAPLQSISGRNNNLFAADSISS